MTASARQRPVSQVPHLPKPVASLRPCGRKPQLLRSPAALPARKRTREERPQRPGNQSRSARFWKSFVPTAIRSRESPPATGSAAIIRQAQECSRFAEPTLIQIVATRNTKSAPLCAETVEDETSLWKTLEI